MKTSITLLAAVLALASAHAQQDFSNVEIKTVHVARNIYMLQGLPERWKGWEAPTLKTDRWLEILYQGLSRK